MFKSYKSVQDMFDSIELEQKKHPIKHFFFTVKCKLEKWFIDNPRDLINNIDWFMQRGLRGYSDYDVWDFDDYLSKVIRDGLTNLKNNSNGHPGELKSMEEWQGILDEIIWIFKVDKEQILKLSPEEKKRYNKGWKLFQKYFYNLWD